MTTFYVSALGSGGGGGGGMNIGGGVAGGTPGSVLFIATGPVLAQDNAKFFWDDTNFRLGIGTTTPAHALDLGSGDIGGVNAIYDSSSPTEFKLIDVANKKLFYGSGSASYSVDWQNGVLNPGGGHTDTLNWQNGNLIDFNVGQASLDWLNRELIASGPIVVANWATSQLNDNSAIASVQWASRLLVDAAAKNSADWGSRVLIDSASSTSYSLNWQSRLLVAPGGLITSVDWGNRILCNASGTTCADWGGGLYLSDVTTGVHTVQWQNMLLKHTPTDVVSIDWGSRTLVNGSGTILDWSSALNFPTGFSSSANMTVNGVAYSWPGSQGSTNSLLGNNGSGGLGWTASPTLTSVSASSFTGGTGAFGAGLTAGTNLGFFGFGPVAQQTAAGSNTYIVNTSTNPVFAESTFSGYTITDIVVALKAYGILG